MAAVGEGPRTVEPLRVTATLRSAVVLPEGTVLLDALLAAAVAVREGLPPISVVEGEPYQIEIPVQREPGGRFHLASAAEGRVAQSQLLYTNKRFPEAQVRALASEDVRRVDTQLGRAKSLRIPTEALSLEDGRLTWWCLGDRAQITELLSWVDYVGKLRTSGHGAVARWEAEPCVPWEGFPVVREGRALRPLPLDWPGLITPEPVYSPLTYPYWQHERAVTVAAPPRIA